MFELAVAAAILLAIIALVRVQDAAAELKTLRQRLEELERSQERRSGAAASAETPARDASASAPSAASVPRPAYAERGDQPATAAGPQTPPPDAPDIVPASMPTVTPPDHAEVQPDTQEGEKAEETHRVRPLAPLPASMRRTEPAPGRRGEDDDLLPVAGRAAPGAENFPKGGGTWDTEDSQSASAGFEARFGSTWLLRIGLVFLVIAAALFGIVVTPRIGPAGKVGVGYLFSALVFGAGLISRRLHQFARPVMAGGLSLAFLVSYAAYFVEPMRCLNVGVSLALMSVFIVAILFFADQWRSEFTGGLAVFLGHVGAFVAARNLESATPSSLVAILFLSTAAVVLLIRRSWVVLSLFAVVAAYVSHLLWTTLAGEAASPAQALYVNLAFLSSYYAIFTISDLLWWRKGSATAEADGLAASATMDRPVGGVPTLGLALGPLNLVLYTSIASLVFLTTKVQFENIHLFYFALALTQGALALIHRSFGNRNFTFYAAAGTVLLTLGFFSAFEDLALNLILAAEAMVLLVIAHQTRLRVFHLFSQAVLLANFLHYWVYASTIDPNRARFIGGMLTAGVYLVKSSLEEVWYAPGTTFAWKRFEPRSSFLRELSDAFDRCYGLVTPILAHLHAVGGALILVDQCRRFLGPVDGGLVLAAGAVAFAALGAWHRSVPMLMVSTFVYAGTFSMAALSSDSGEASPASLALIRSAGSLAAGVGFALVAVRTRPDRFRYGLCFWPGATLVLFLLGFTEILRNRAESTGPSLIWFVAIIAGLVAVERFAAVWRINLRVKRRTRGFFIAAEIGAGSILAIHLFSLFDWKFAGAPLQFVLISGLASILPLIALVRRTAGVYAAGWVLMTLLFLRIGASDTQRHALFDSLPATLATALPLIAVAWTQDLLVRLFDELLTQSRRVLAFVVIAVPYAYGLILLFGLMEIRLGEPWSYGGGVALCGALMCVTQPAKLFRGAALSAFFFSLVALSFVADYAGEHPEAWGYLGVTLSILVAGFGMERLWTLGEAALNRRGPLSADFRPVDLASIGRLALLLSSTAVALSSAWNSTMIGPRWTTAAWAIYAALVMIMGFAYRRASFRRIALGVLALCTARVLLVDIRDLETVYQAFALLVLGLCLVAIAWLYSRFNAQLRRWL